MTTLNSRAAAVPVTGRALAPISTTLPVKRVPGIAGFGGCICEWLRGGVPGITVRVGERDRLYVEIVAVAHMNQRLEHLGGIVQEAVLSEFKDLPGLRPVAIDVIFTGIRYDKRALPKSKEYSR